MHTCQINVEILDKNFIIDEISHHTKFRTELTENIQKALYHRQKLPIPVVSLLSRREVIGGFAAADRCHILGQYLPFNGPRCIDSTDLKAYVSQFSDDGSILVAAFKEGAIKVYDVENQWNVRNYINAENISRTITDASLSPSKSLIAYASISPTVHIVDVRSATTDSHANNIEIHDGLDFSIEGVYDFIIYSIQFSSDGRELVTGSDYGFIHIYDLEANRVKTHFEAHSEDVNTVTFADETGNIIYSGGENTICKIWDMRCSTLDSKAAGSLSGHMNGITYIDSRGDGRYFISNGYDHTTKLWDVRRMSSESYDHRRVIDWVFRHNPYPLDLKKDKHSNDQSIATYRGHTISRDLIRCYFSPVHSIGQKYIYTGSSDGCVYIYEVINGAQVAKLDLHDSIVRDCSWHPFYPILVGSSLDGIVARWEFP